MIRRSPAETYLKYLLLHPRGYTHEQIKSMAWEAQVDFLGDWYLKKLKDGLHPPEPFHPFDRAHRPSWSYLMKTGMCWIFDHDDRDTARAFDILERPRVKEFVEAMILGGAPHAAIVSGLVRQRKFSCSERAIERYRSFFWNIDLLDSTEMRGLLKLRLVQLEDHPDPQVRKHAEALKHAYWIDPRKVASELPFSPLSALTVQMRMGLHPSKVEVGKVLDYAVGVLSIRIAETATNNGPSDAKRCSEYSNSIARLQEAREKIVRPDDDLREQLMTISLRTVEGAVPTLRQLSQGNHTTEVAVIEATNELPADADYDEEDAGSAV